MRASVRGIGLNGTGGAASVGDPFDLAANPGSTVSFVGLSLQPAPTTVPEPATATLAAFGLAALAAAGRFRFRRPAARRGVAPPPVR